MGHDKTEYSSHALAAVVDRENRNDWILVIRSSIGKYKEEQDNNLNMDNK